MSLKVNNSGVAGEFQTLAVSDGELNVLDPIKAAGTQCSNSNCSLPSVPGGGANGVGQVASWAVSFERLLEDPQGVCYFTEFLKSEVSVENILFWQACENFRKIPVSNTEKLSKEALSIYNGFLSKYATSPINIDDRGRVDEKDIQNPHPELFQKAQQQIFKLMKFDSYTRFVRSQLYQNCMLANVEGRSLPELGQSHKAPLTAKESNSTGIREQPKSELKSKEKLKLKPSKPGMVSDDMVERRKGKPGMEKRKEKRSSWGESQFLGRPGSLHGFEVERLLDQATEAGNEMKPTADKYCCVFLPDGTASLTPARAGMSIRSMLTGVCEKRGLPLSDIIIYLHGKDKKALSLDQDSSVLKDQQVYLEHRVSFAVEVVFTSKNMALVVKSNKTLQEALSSVLQKHRLRPQDVIVTMKGSSDVIPMNTVVTNLANKSLILDKVIDTDQTLGTKIIPAIALQTRRGAVDIDTSATAIYRPNAKQRNPVMRRTYDMEGLVELLNRAQGCSADDQRGLLNKEDLVVPQFLQLAPEENEDEEKEEEEEKQTEEERDAEPLRLRSTEELREPNSKMPSEEKEFIDPSGDPFPSSTEPADSKLTEKQCSNSNRETVV